MRIKKPFPVITVVVLVAIILILGVGYGGWYFYNKYQQIKINPEIITKEETSFLVERISKLMDVPQDETPTLATVLDKEKLKDQAFFANADNGDKVLIYTKAKKAILFRPSTNKIIDVSPLSLDSSAVSSQNINIALLNGTTESSVTSDTEKTLNSKLSNITISKKALAAKTDYTSTLVYDSSGKYASQATQIADAINGKVTSVLPAGESKVDGADIVIIIGK